MLVAAAVCPHPPLMVPALAAGAAGELDALRRCCDEAVRSLVAVAPDVVVVVGAAASTGPFPAEAWGTLAPYGVEQAVGAPTPACLTATLPLSLLIGRWLLDRVAPAAPRVLVGVTSDAGTEECLLLGGALAHRAPRVALLVMGDGSARRSPKGPGYLDDRAEPYDLGVQAALGGGDLDDLAALDPVLSRDLLVAGRAPWQVLAGAGSGQPWTGQVLFACSPYGVTYLVAALVPAPARVN